MRPLSARLAMHSQIRVSSTGPIGQPKITRSIFRRNSFSKKSPFQMASSSPRRDRPSGLAESIYQAHLDLVDQISEYEEQKDNLVKTDPCYKLLPILRDPQEYQAYLAAHPGSSLPAPTLAFPGVALHRGSWAEFIQVYQFFTCCATEAQSYKGRYFVYPNPEGELMNPASRNLYGKSPPEGFAVEYDFRNKILAIDLYGVVMLDYDLKDGWTRQGVIDYLSWVVAEAEGVGLHLTFLLQATDRGVHAFLVSHPYQRGLFWVDLLLALRNDFHYTSFAHVRGFGVRLTAKPDTPQDRVAWFAPYQPPAEGEPVDVELEVCCHLDSVYLGRKLELKWFDIHTPGLIWIGKRTETRVDVLKLVHLQYLLTQYGRALTQVERKQIESDVYGQAIYPFSGRMDQLQADVAAIWGYVRSRYTAEIPSVQGSGI